MMSVTIVSQMFIALLFVGRSVTVFTPERGGHLLCPAFSGAVWQEFNMTRRPPRISSARKPRARRSATASLSHVAGAPPLIWSLPPRAHAANPFLAVTRRCPSYVPYPEPTLTDRALTSKVHE